MDVRLPDGTIIRGVPEGITRAQLAAKLQANGMMVPQEWLSTPKEGDLVPASGIPEGFYAVTGPDGKQTLRRKLGASDITQMLYDLPGVGTAANIAAGTANLGVKALSGLAGLLSGGKPDVVRSVQEKLSVAPVQSRDPVLQALGAASRPLERAAAPVESAVANLSPGARTALEAAAEAVNDVAALTPGLGAARAIRAASRAAEAERPLAALSAAERQAIEQRPVSGETPTTAQLRELAQQAYARADEAGLVIRPQSAARLKASIAQAIEKEGGADPTLHSHTSAALRRIMDMEPRTLQDIDRMRQIVLDAAGSPSRADRRLAQIVRDRIDDYADRLSTLDIMAGNPQEAVQAIREARDYWSRFRKSEIIDELVRKAQIDAGKNYTQSGLENALRTRFAQLARNLKQMRQFTPEERAAIEKVAKGGPLENTLRFIGKFAPHGVVTSAVLAGLGHEIGGLGGLAAAGAAEAGRLGATRLTQRNVQRASELVRSGRTVPRREEPVAQPAAAAPASAPPRALPAPAFIVTPQGRVATESALRDIGMTPDVMRAGAAHPGAERPASLLTMLNNQPLALPSQVTLPMGSDALEAARRAEMLGLTPDVVAAGAAHPGAPRPARPEPPPSLLSLPAPTPEPIVVDRAGRAGSRAALDQYLSETGLGEVQRARVGAPGQSSRPTETGEPPGLLSQPKRKSPPKQYKQAASKAPAFAELSEAPSTAGIDVVEHSLPDGGGGASLSPSGGGLPPGGPSEGALLAQRLAQFPEAFRYPIVRGQGKTLPEVMQQIAPDMRVTGSGGRYTITDPATGSLATVEVQDGAVVLNISRFRPSQRGSAIYQAIGDWAHSNGLRFIGDPEGLSPLAQIRRTSNMLSSALRHGTTEHIEPHALQRRPEVAGVRPLGWTFGDDVHNLNELVASEVETYRALVPEIRDVRYNPKTERFEKNGHVFTDADFDALADRARRRSIRPLRDDSRRVPGAARPVVESGGLGPSTPVGRDTLKRVAFLQSGVRPLHVGRLAETRGRRSQHRQALPPALKGLLYGGAGLGLAPLFQSDDESGEPVGLLGRIPVGVH